MKLPSITSVSKYPLVILFAFGANFLLYLAMSNLSYKKEIDLPKYEKAIFLSLPKDRPIRKKPIRKQIHKKKMPKNLPKLKNAAKPLIKAPPQFELGNAGGDFVINTHIDTGISVSMPKFKAPKSLFDLKELDRIPQVIYRVSPIYPYSAKRRNVTGYITIQFVVDSAGKVGNITILKAKPKGVFEDSAKKAVQKWRFKPGYYQGEPVATRIVLPINFNI